MACAIQVDDRKRDWTSHFPADRKDWAEVTDYVRNEFDRAEALANDKQAGTVGFALTILQRRLASSPEAIYQSLAAAQ